MTRISTTFTAALALGLIVATASAQTRCPGDCDGNNSVGIAELITCVNISLGAAELSTCTACDPSGDGMVGIAELIRAVNVSLGAEPCPAGTPGGAVCGDGHVDTAAGEECDDGNNFGGDGCAANCTNEITRMTDLDPAKSISVVQLQGLPIMLNLTGHQVLIAGTARDTAVMGPGGKTLFNPGEFPLAVRAVDVQFDPINVLGSACACVRAIPVPEFGEGISGVGVVGCGDQGLTNVNVRFEQDHDTSPGSIGNSGPDKGLPDDPQCNAHVDSGGGVVSDACLEGVGAACTGPDNVHVAGFLGPGNPAACNSPRVVTFSGGQGPRGSVLLRTKTQIGVLTNTLNPVNACLATLMPDGSCSAPDFGKDCVACTDDDLKKGTPNVGVTTSGTAEVIIYDANDSTTGLIAPDQTCGRSPCIAQVTGLTTDCDALKANPNGPLTGALVTAFPSLDQPMTGDTANTTTLAAQNP